MSDNSKLFEKYIFNNKIEISSRLAVPPLTLSSSNENWYRKTIRCPGYSGWGR